MKVLVTGCNGFTGQYLVQELERSGYDVYGIGTRIIPSHKRFRVDLLDSERLNELVCTIKPDMIFHLAGISFVATEDASLLYKTNLIGSYNLLHSISSAKCGHNGILIASSANVYGSNAQGKVTEEVTPNPISHYGISKLSMEKMAKLFDVPHVIARPFNYTGIGQNERFLIPKIVKCFKNKERTLELGNIEVSREFGDVRNVVNLYKKLLEQPLRGVTVNVCTEKPYKIDDIIKKCNKISGYMPEIVVSQNFKRDNEINILYGDRSKLETLVHVDHEDSIDKLLTWMLLN